MPPTYLKKWKKWKKKQKWEHLPTILSTMRRVCAQVKVRIYMYTKINSIISTSYSSPIWPSGAWISKFTWVRDVKMRKIKKLKLFILIYPDVRDRNALFWNEQTRAIRPLSFFFFLLSTICLILLCYSITDWYTIY